MKKRYMFLILFVLIFVAVSAGTVGVAYAQELDYSESDLLFLKTLEELSESQDNYNKLKASKEVLYDIEIQPLGFVYDFILNGISGYAIITDVSGIGLCVNEIYFDALNPFLNAGENTRIYLKPFVYALFANGKFTLLDCGISLTKNELNAICTDAYNGAGNLIFGTEEIAYSYRTVNKYNMVQRFPSYTVSGLSNSCSPIAGGNIVAFYDRYCTDLIPDYTPGNSMGTKYLYKASNATTNSLIQQLYYDMGTNSIVPGTTKDQFISGMTTYCARKGYNISFKHCNSSSQFNYQSVKQEMVNGKPIALFLSKYNVSNIIENDNLDKLNYMRGSLKHMMVGFGYKEISYTFANGSGRTDNYINVASGLSEMKSGYFNVTTNADIDSVCAVTIY